MTRVNNPLLNIRLHSNAEAKQIVKEWSNGATEELVIGKTKAYSSTLGSRQCDQEARLTSRGAQRDLRAGAGKEGP